MKRLALILLLTAGPAGAEWVDIGAPEEGATTYIDSTRLKIDGQMRRAWVMMEEAGGIGVALFQVDCGDERLRTLQFTAYDEVVSPSAVVFTELEPGPWVFAQPNTAHESVLKFVCSLPK